MNMNHSTAFPYREARIDSAIEIGDLDRQGIERLIRAMFPITMLEDDIDFDAICEAMEGFEPAFIMGTFRRTKSNAIIRTESSNFKLATSDFVLAANGLRNQHDTHHNALDRPEVEAFSTALKREVSGAVKDLLTGDLTVDVHDTGDILVKD